MRTFYKAVIKITNPYLTGIIRERFRIYCEPLGEVYAGDDIYNNVIVSTDWDGNPMIEGGYNPCVAFGEIPAEAFHIILKGKPVTQDEAVANGKRRKNT